MASGLTVFRRGVAKLMDVFGDAVNAVALFAAAGVAWKCWTLFLRHYGRTGGIGTVPDTWQGWERVGTAAWMMAQSERGRQGLKQVVVDWSVSWFALVGAVAATALVVMGIRWTWVRLRDLIAGA